MKLSELIEEVNKDIDDSLPNSDIIGWLNRALDDLSPYARYQKMSTISVVSEQKEYPLPTDVIEVLFVVDDGTQLSPVQQMDFKTTGYKKWGSNLIMQPTPDEDKEVDLYYHGQLPYLAEMDDVPVIPTHFHDLLVLFAVAKAKYQDEEDGAYNSAMQEYFIKKDLFISEVAKTSEAGSVYYIKEDDWYGN